MINLGNSFIYFIAPKNSWRTNIKSVLKIEDKTYYLVKECRAEIIDEQPFSHYIRHEFLGIIENEKTHTIRTSACSRNKANVQMNDQLKNKKSIVETNIVSLSFEEINEILSTEKKINIFCEIQYDYENAKYSLISKCEFINYNTDKSDTKYLQPIMGYVPFILKKQLRYSYVVLNVGENRNGYLEFLLNEKTPIFNTNTEQNFIILFIKKTLNKLLFFFKKNDFTKLISIKNSKIKFFSYL